MSKEVTKLEARAGYHLYVEFSDGTAGVIDLSDRLFGPVFEPLRDEALFDQVRVDEFGAICWPNGADLAPDAVYMRLAGSNEASATGEPFAVSGASSPPVRTSSTR